MGEKGEEVYWKREKRGKGGIPKVAATGRNRELFLQKLHNMGKRKSRNRWKPLRRRQK